MAAMQKGVPRCRCKEYEVTGEKRNGMAGEAGGPFIKLLAGPSWAVVLRALYSEAALHCGVHNRQSEQC